MPRTTLYFLIFASLAVFAIVGCSLVSPKKPKASEWEVVTSSNANGPTVMPSDIQGKTQTTAHPTGKTSEAHFEGIARMGRSGPVIETDDSLVTIQKLKAWPQNVVGQRVTATGHITRLEFGKKSTFGNMVGKTGKHLYLSDATWSLAK